MHLRQGSAVYIRIATWDQTQTPPALANVTSAAITLLRPDGTIALNGAGMTNSGTGTYYSNYQSLATDTVGLWQMFFTLIANGLTIITEPEAAFDVVE